MTPPSSANAPAYLTLHETGELARRAAQAVAALDDCTTCPRACHADRGAGAAGGVRDPRNYCGVGRHAVVASASPHFGEESPLVGRRGSGTIFFSGCNLGCLFCQNHDISVRRRGRPLSGPDLAALMLDLQAQGCHNINVVTPSHVVPQLLEALVLAAEQGLRLPLVYNSGGYDSLETLAWLDGVVDIYMPDLKFLSRRTAAQLVAAPDYPDVARAALREMHRQVGVLTLDGAGVAVRGLLVRHLVMPEGLSDSAQVCRFIARELSPDTYVNVMAQYRPCGEIARVPALCRRPTPDEYLAAVAAARAAGLHRLDGDG